MCQEIGLNPRGANKWLRFPLENCPDFTNLWASHSSQPFTYNLLITLQFKSGIYLVLIRGAIKSGKGWDYVPTRGGGGGYSNSKSQGGRGSQLLSGFYGSPRHAKYTHLMCRKELCLGAKAEQGQAWLQKRTNTINFQPHTTSTLSSQLKELTVNTMAPSKTIFWSFKCSIIDPQFLSIIVDHVRAIIIKVRIPLKRKRLLRKLVE